jgi:hypothetical protein
VLGRCVPWVVLGRWYHRSSERGVSP